MKDFLIYKAIYDNTVDQFIPLRWLFRAISDAIYASDKYAANWNLPIDFDRKKKRRFKLKSFLIIENISLLFLYQNNNTPSVKHLFIFIQTVCLSLLDISLNIYIYISSIVFFNERCKSQMKFQRIFDHRKHFITLCVLKQQLAFAIG